MKREIEKILQNTPYNTYDDLFGAVYSNKATVKLSNSACRQIAQTKRPFLANFGLHFGIIPSAIITIGFSIYSTNYYLLLLLLLELLFPFAIYLLNNFRVKTGFIGVIAVLCDLFLIRLPLFVLIAALSWMLCSWTVNWWVKKVYTESIKILRYNEDAFEWAYNSHNLLIEDCYGNVFSKLRQDQLQMESYERLLRILKIGADAEDVDDAIKKFSAFYIKKGKDIPNELYFGVAHCSKQEKCENLLRILEIGIGVVGIENVSKKLIEFYKAKGVNFPNDVL